jgi:hypothetical protein
MRRAAAPLAGLPLLARVRDRLSTAGGHAGMTQGVLR